MIAQITRFLNTYGYDNISQFCQSLCPTAKYQLLPQSITISSIFGVICTAVGVWPVICFAMFITLVLELLTGLVASHVIKNGFESSKFSRFTLKLAIWFILLISCQLF